MDAKRHYVGLDVLRIIAAAAVAFFQFTSGFAGASSWAPFG
jgi:peptidoglycan/LPS O-acetylase OafA/YrhL